MKVPLLKTSFVGRRSELKKVIETLKSTAAFEMTFFKRAAHEIADEAREDYDRLLALQKKVQAAITFALKCDKELKIKNSAWNTRNLIEYKDLKVYAEYENDALEIVKHIEDLQAHLGYLKTTITQNEQTIKDLRAYHELPVAFNLLQSTNSAFFLCGIIPHKSLERFKSDFDLSKFSINEVPSGKDNRMRCVVISCHREDAPLAEVIYDFDFEMCKFDFDKNAVEMTDILTRKNVELDAQYKSALQQIIIPIEELRTVKNFYDYVSDELDTADLTANTLQTQAHYVMNGWIIASEEPAIRTILEQEFPGILLKFEQPGEFDEPPVLIKNSRIVTPFQQVTNMYGMPAGGDIDPNPFVAIFYFIFFGMMVGDVGYGLLLMAGVALFIYLKKPLGNTKQFILLFGIGGISIMLWGFFYGSIFGFYIPSQVINPMDAVTHGAIYLLLLSLALGFIQILFGICLSFYRNIINKKYWDAILDSLPRIILFVGLFMFLPKAAFALFNLPISYGFLDAMSKPGLYIALAGIVGIVLFNGRKKKGILGKLLGAFSGAYGLINYFNDVISYVRLFALALVGVVLAYIGNTVGGMMFGLPIGIGYILGTLIAIIFHAFNIGLGLLSAYVHGARLQFIEFFSKFYTGDGKAFKPLGSDLKYTYIRRRGD